ncbi:MAG: DDE-type integrase/transposase/recombinase [Planctomycetaceae bacterium]|nr:DDE-type integrase/transposase/recombinase [Planctomycetales bacterium]MCB9921507.1 DDE-type integrase/transposase/recombinase [Planctomycetaceae bacterium]
MARTVYSILDRHLVVATLYVAMKIAEFSFDRVRIPDGIKKQRPLRGIRHARTHLPLRSVLALIGMSRTRYHAWLGKQECGLDDQRCCPRTTPQQLTHEEYLAIRDMVTAGEYRHVPTGTLARLAQRLGIVFASSTTWYRLVRTHNWRRPRQRIHPAKPTVGISATRANEIWHVDTTLIRLLDGSKAYLHAIIDNFSRRVLAWRVNDSFIPSVTAELLIGAFDGSSDKPQLLVDGGVENYNNAVNKLVDSGILKRILAQTEIRHSNSLIESWWRVIKHQWLFLNTLDTVVSVRKLVAFYVEQHNSHLPHSAFKGQTPDELYFGTGDGIPEKLEAAKSQARELRVKTNREWRVLTLKSAKGLGAQQG